MDDIDNKQPLVGGDSEEFMTLMSRALSRIEQVDRATAKANENLNRYANGFNELNEQLERYIKLSSNNKSGKFDKININDTASRATSRSKSFKGGTSNSTSTVNTNQYALEAKKVTDGVMNTVFRSINSLGGRQARLVTSTFKEITGTVGDVKQLSKGAKAATGMAKAQKAATAATGEGSKAMAGLGATTLGVTTVVGGIVIALAAMGKAGKYAYDRNMQVNRSLMSMGDASSEMTSSSNKVANQMIGIKNTWSRIGDDLAGVFEPVFNLVVDFVETIGNTVETVTGTLDKDSKRQFTSSDSKARWYTSELERTSGEPENKSLPVIGNIASSAKQSGFDNTSAANLAIGTYDMAIMKARQYGVEAVDVAKKLSDAWLSGSDAAKEYGVVVDDQTLVGYMSSRGVDIVNTQISDAMKQYYRYQLMQEELSADSNDDMQKQIKGWKQLGMQIDATKQKLFSFDEVIQLGALNTDIPTVGTPDVSYPNDDGSGSIPAVPPILPGGGTPDYPGDATSTVTVPLVYEPQNEWALQPAVSTVNVPVFVPGLDLVGELVYELGLVLGLSPVPVTAPVAVPDFERLTSLEEQLGTLNGLVPLPVTVPVDVPDFQLAPELLAYCRALAANPFVSTVAFGIPALALAPTLLGYLFDIANNWSAEVDISVAGMKLLQQAQSLLQNVLSLVQRAGQAVGSGVINAYNTARSSVGMAYNKAKTYVTGGSGDWETAVKQEGYSARDINTAKSMARTNNEDWDSLGSHQKTQYVKVADTVNSNVMITKADGIEMLNSYGATGQATSSKVDWMKTEGTQIANTGLKVAGGMGLAGGALVTGGLAAPLLEGAGTAVASWLSGLGGEAAAFGMKDGGIGTKESTIRAFEGNKKEAVIPLETQAGVDYLANAMEQAGAGGSTQDTGSTQVYLTLSGVNIADNEAQWQKVGEKIAEVIDVQRQSRGELNYGSSF